MVPPAVEPDRPGSTRLTILDGGRSRPTDR
jgi:hypothetical protein